MPYCLLYFLQVYLSYKKLSLNKCPWDQTRCIKGAKGVVYVSTKLLSPIFERLWQLREVPGDWRKANVMPVFKKGKKEDLHYCRLVGPTSVSVVVMKEICLEAISRHMKEKMMIGEHQEWAYQRQNMPDQSDCLV